jgi:GNAT superfamily N-acetyltransferase
MDKSPELNCPQNNLLEPMDLDNTTQFDELLRQRVICGWDFSRSTIEAWRDAIAAHTISLFWVVPASLSQLDTPQRLAGHISMLRKTEPPNNTPVLHICNLFILPEHRRGGLGRQAVQALESWAKFEPYGSPECKAITLNAISKRYIEDDAEEWRGMYLRFCRTRGIEEPAKGSSNEDWYARMGYVKETEQPMYPVDLDGREFKLIASWMRKELE